VSAPLTLDPQRRCRGCGTVHHGSVNAELDCLRYHLTMSRTALHGEQVAHDVTRSELAAARAVKP
jgi:hypothetical protein